MENSYFPEKLPARQDSKAGSRKQQSLALRLAFAVIGALIVDGIKNYIEARIHGHSYTVPALTLHEFTRPTYWPELFLFTALALIQDTFMIAGVYVFKDDAGVCYMRRRDLPRWFFLYTFIKVITLICLISGLSRPVMTPMVALVIGVIPLCIYLVINTRLICNEILTGADIFFRAHSEARQQRYENLFEINKSLDSARVGGRRRLGAPAKDASDAYKVCAELWKDISASSSRRQWLVDGDGGTPHYVYPPGTNDMTKIILLFSYSLDSDSYGLYSSERAGKAMWITVQPSRAFPIGNGQRDIYPREAERLAERYRDMWSVSPERR
ncbi:MAG TPA: hypothetical protein VHO07_25980 [Streptosporangiaceae bacterium]|jgi:hypothetical protein|nr:hypothetical protein [Streptosporangiaceae bacterium]